MEYGGAERKSRFLDSARNDNEKLKVLLRSKSQWTRSGFAGHDEQRLHFEAAEMGPEPCRVVVLFYVYDFLRGDYGIDRHVVVASVLQHNEPAVDLVEQQVEGEIAVGHGHD
jgi:hypothetical protein